MHRTALLATLGVLVLLVVLLGVGQLVLPGIAAQRLRDRLSKSGSVLEVQVHAFPAIELLWHQADRVVIRMGSYRSDPGHLGSLLAEASDVGSLDASASVLDAGLLTLRDATLTKRGDELIGSARVTEADLRASVPFLESVQPVASGGGQLVLRGTANVLGFAGSVDATVRPQDGALIVSPDVPFGGLAAVTIFSNPHVAVESVAASPRPDGFAVSGRGKLQ